MSYCHNCGRDARNSRFCTMCGSQLDTAPGPTAEPVGSDPFEHFFRPQQEFDAASAKGEVISAAEIEDLGATHVAVNAAPGAQRSDQTVVAGGADAPTMAAPQAGVARPPGDHGLDLVLGQPSVSTTQTFPAIDAEATSVIAMPFGATSAGAGGGYPPGAPPGAGYPAAGYAGMGGPPAGRVRARRSPWFWVAILAVPALAIAVLGWVLTAQHSAPAAATVPPPASQPTPVASATPSQQAPTPSASASAPTTATGLLRPGSQGLAVKQVQDRLNELGLFDGTSDGVYGQDTAQAVMQFQSQAEVTGDPAGVVGAHTLEALTAAGSTPALGDGDRGRPKDVRRLQGALSVALGVPLARTGKYDAATAQAVQQYQLSRQLSPDTPGVMDDGTWAALQRGT